MQADLRTLSDRDALIARLDALLRACAPRCYLVVLRPRKLSEIEHAEGPGAAAGVLDALRRRLERAAGEEGCVTDVGGGAFALLGRVPGDVEEFVNDVLAAASRPVRRAGEAMYLPANAAVCPVEAALGNGEQHLERALRALQQAMSRGPGGVETVSESRIERDAAEWEMRTRLEQAAMRGEFAIEYQPIHSLATGAVVKLEALLRWDSPDFGRVGPDRFVPMLEESGLIRPVGEWVLREACRQARQWRERDGMQVRVAVNLSPVQLAADFEQVAQRVLAETGCAAGWIELEITEGALIRDFARIRLRLEALAALGFTLAIDDFGAGYSSLAQLAQLPFHHLKIDRSLIEGLPDGGKRADIIRAVVALADALGLAVTSEGVERAAQAEWLSGLGDLHAQGYLFARPMGAEAIGSLLGPPAAAARR